MILNDKINEIRILAATGVLGSGFSENSFQIGLKKKPHFIGVDSGSTDPGPNSLATGISSFPKKSIKRDLRILVVASIESKIPLIIGSSGTAGGKPHLEFVYNILKEITVEENLSFKVGLINSEQDPNYLKEKLKMGKIIPLHPAPVFNEKVIDKSIRIVGMMGIAPYIEVLSNNVNVVLAGRSSDTAIFAAIPIKLGFSEGLSWHAGKILECGAAAATHRKNPDCLMATLRKDHFIIEPLDPSLKCTPQSVAAHSLYENADPYLIVEPEGTLDLRESKYEALDDRKVKVTGSNFLKTKNYTIKLEGVELAGYQSIVIGSIRDPLIINQIDSWLERLELNIQKRVNEIYKNEKRIDYNFNTNVYGKNGTMGKIEPNNNSKISHELCLIFEITAESQNLAAEIAAITRHQALHLPIPEWEGLITALACPYNPAHINRGPVYRFNTNHVVEVDDELEMFKIKYSKLNEAQKNHAKAV